MSRGLRLSQSEFTRLSPAIRGILPDLLQNPLEKRVKTRTAARIIRAVATAITEVSERRGVLEIRFDGARLATLNDLFAMTIQERRRYRMAWHELIRDAALAQFNGRPPLFPAAGIALTRYGPREVDPDAIIPKAPIDGLRYAGFLPEDTASVVQSLSLNQAVGSYAVLLKLSAIRKKEAS